MTAKYSFIACGLVFFGYAIWEVATGNTEPSISDIGYILCFGIAVILHRLQQMGCK